jgi:DUF4097 and DUF4098 domain-containing protein YvlB
MKNEIRITGLIIAAGLAAAPVVADAQDERTATQIDTTVRLDRGGSVDLSLISGKIRVTGWDQPTVKISASIESGNLRFSANSSRVTLSVDEEGNNNGNRRHRNRDTGDARYDVSVPRGAKLILEAVSGDVIAKGSQGEIEASSVSGEVDVTDGVRSVSVESVSGDARAAQINGNLHAETVSGELRAENVTGEVEASTVSGDITLTGIQSTDVRTETVSGEIRYTGSIEPTGRYSYESHSGTIVLNIPRNAGASFSVETFSGGVNADFPITIPPRERGSNRDGGRMNFTIGDGRARITAQTFSGEIEINSGSTTRRNDE